MLFRSITHLTTVRENVFALPTDECVIIINKIKSIQFVYKIWQSIGYTIKKISTLLSLKIKVVGFFIVS